MKRMNLVLAAVAVLLGTALTGTALAQDNGRHQGWGNHDGWNNGRNRATTFDGSWVSDNNNASFNGRGMMRELLLPNRINIDQSPSLVKITDRRNRQLQLITLGGKFGNSRGGDYVAGRLYGNTLVVKHDGPRGSTITQTFEVQDRGRTLVVTTKREGFGPRTAEFTSTYHRA